MAAFHNFKGLFEVLRLEMGLGQGRGQGEGQRVSWDGKDWDMELANASHLSESSQRQNYMDVGVCVCSPFKILMNAALNTKTLM